MEPVTTTPDMQRRRVFCVLSPRSLSYARYTLASLFANVREPIHLNLITDTEIDKITLEEELFLRQKTKDHGWSVFSEADLADREADKFGRFPSLIAFRRGHPCWRKITDPLLLSDDGEEMVLLDPDLYFPNQFRFEETPKTGVLLMRQRPHCLWPPEIVKAAMRAGLPVAHHIDIGVGQWREPVDLEWLDWLIGSLGGENIPRMMHVEAILWSIIAMRIGGGYLDPTAWHCWHRSRLTQLRMKLGTSGVSILKWEKFSAMKCFHAGGAAKSWLAEAQKAGLLDCGNDRTGATPVAAYEELRPETYYREQKVQKILHGLLPQNA